MFLCPVMNQLLLVLLYTQVIKHKIPQKTTFYQMLPPYFSPHFLTRQHRLWTKLVQVNENQVTNAMAELLHWQVFQFLRILWHHFVGNVLALVIAQVFQVFLVDVTLAELTYDFYVFVIKRHFYLVLEKALYEFLAFLLAPQKWKNLVYDVQLEVFLNVTATDRRFLFWVLLSHVSLIFFLTSGFLLSVFEFCLFDELNFLKFSLEAGVFFIRNWNKGILRKLIDGKSGKVFLLDWLSLKVKCGGIGQGCVGWMI